MLEQQTSGPSSDLLNSILNFNKSPCGSSAHWSLRSTALGGYDLLAMEVKVLSDG